MREKRYSRFAASVQAHFVPLREITDEMLCLCRPGRANVREYQAVLEISGLNYALKSEAEQRALNDLFRGFLAGLSHPLQILVRVTPLDLERHLRQFEMPDPTDPLFAHPTIQAYLARWQKRA